MVAVVALVLGGCGMDVAGAPLPAALPDPGPYPTTRVAPPRSPGVSTGTILEGQRMAANVVVPMEVDATLQQLEGPNTGPVADAQALRADIRARRAQIAQSHRFVAGFSSARSTRGAAAPDTSMVNLVMRFADPAAAAAAAAEMVAAEPTWRPMPVARHPGAAALAFEMPRGVIVESFTPRGPYVFYQWVQTHKTAAAATELIASTLDLQGPRIDSFVPADPARLGDLPADPTGLLAHTLPVPPPALTPAIGVYPAQGALHFQTDPVTAAELFSAAGVTAVSLGLATVYQAENETGAALLVDRLAAEAVRNGATPAGGVAGLPNAECVDRGAGPTSAESRYQCFAHAGRYAFSTSAREAREVRQRAGAQYLMLDGL